MAAKIKVKDAAGITSSYSPIHFLITYNARTSIARNFTKIKGEKGLLEIKRKYICRCKNQKETLSCFCLQATHAREEVTASQNGNSTKIWQWGKLHKHYRAANPKAYRLFQNSSCLALQKQPSYFEIEQKVQDPKIL